MSDELSLRQQNALTILLRASSLRDAATRAGISERTVRYWLHQEAFKEALREIRKSLTSQVAHRLAGVQSELLEMALQMIRDQTVAPATRLRAILELLDSPRATFLTADLQTDLDKAIDASKQYAVVRNGVPPWPLTVPPDVEDREDGEAGEEVEE